MRCTILTGIIVCFAVMMLLGMAQAASAKRVANNTTEVPNSFMVPFIPNGTWESGVPPGFIKPRRPGTGDSGVPRGFIKPRKPGTGDSGVPSGFINPIVPNLSVLLYSYY